nr:hypothetical protein CFP56_48731 [Quercus suber]
MESTVEVAARETSHQVQLGDQETNDAKARETNQHFSSSSTVSSIPHQIVQAHLEFKSRCADLKIFWQTSSRSRPSNSASRTPQNRSSNPSPAPSATPAQPARQGQPVNSVWTQRGTSNTGTNNNNYNANSITANSGASAISNGQPKGASPMEDSLRHTPVNNFNNEEIKAFLSRQPTGMVYKVYEAPGAGKGVGGTAWGAKAGNTASNQPFFGQLAKQIAMLEGEQAIKVQKIRGTNAEEYSLLEVPTWRNCSVPARSIHSMWPTMVQSKRFDELRPHMCSWKTEYEGALDAIHTSICGGLGKREHFSIV